MRAGFFCLAEARWQGMFSQMGLGIWIKWTSNYLDAQSLDDTLLLRWSSAAPVALKMYEAGAAGL